MNVVLVLIDSLNRSSLSAYGPSEIATPNLDTFARRAWRFDNHFAGSLPCVPARRDIFAGFKEVLWRPWGPLEPFDDRLPSLLSAQGYRTGIVTDHHHYWAEAGNGYIQSFQSAKLIRGHAVDYWEPPTPADEPVPPWVDNIAAWRPPAAGRRYYANVKDFQSEEDFFAARVFSEGAQWLRDHGGHAPFFLQVESFDPHEPFHVPEPYASMYGDPSGYDKFTVWPPYQNPQRLREFMAQVSPEELAFIRAQYAGKITMVDRWFGELIATIEEMDLWDDTMVIVTTDHGHDLGEREAFGKQHPHFDSHANIPLFIWHPEYPGNGGAVPGLTSTVDLFATTLETAGVPVPARTHSRSILPHLSGAAPETHSAVLYGSFGQGLCCTDGDWTLLKAPERDGPLYAYSSMQFRSLVFDSLAPPVGSGRFIPGVDLPQWQIPLDSSRALTTAMLSRDDFLFNRREDPGQTRNLWDSEPDQRRRMLEVMRTLMASEGAPLEQYERLGVPG
ncbi:MAG: sulfatase [Chloroflexota bacterium]|nr:sulfatase [Chloroflexota bacterium]